MYTLQPSPQNLLSCVCHFCEELTFTSNSFSRSYSRSADTIACLPRSSISSCRKNRPWALALTALLVTTQFYWSGGVGRAFKTSCTSFAVGRTFMLFLPRARHLTKIGPGMKRCGIWKRKLIIGIRIVNVSWVGFMFRL